MKIVKYMRIGLSGKGYTADSLCMTDKAYKAAEQLLKDFQGKTRECFLEMHDVLTEAAEHLWEAECPKAGRYWMQFPHCTSKAGKNGTVATLTVHNRKVMCIAFTWQPVLPATVITDDLKTAEEVISMKVLHTHFSSICNQKISGAVESLACSVHGQVTMSGRE